MGQSHFYVKQGCYKRDKKINFERKENRGKTKYYENDKKVCPNLLEKKREKEKE